MSWVGRKPLGTPRPDDSERKRRENRPQLTIYLLASTETGRSLGHTRRSDGLSLWIGANPLSQNIKEILRSTSRRMRR